MLRDPEVPKKVGARTAEVLSKYHPWRKDGSEYPVGTQIPLTIDGADYVFMFDWHRHAQNAPGDPRLKNWHWGITVFGPDVQTLAGRWLVTFDTGWSWYYTFQPGKVVSYTDIKDPPELSGDGTWAYVGKSVRVVWPESSEEWPLPLNPGGERGQSLVGQGGLSAQKV
jgi:hypothetical protein